MGSKGIARWIYAAFILIGLAVPLVVRNDYVLHILIMVGIWAVLSLGLELVLGFTGLFSLGHAAFYGMGAYISALLSLRFGLSFWLTLPLSVLGAALFGVLLGFPALRLRGDYLAIATLGFGEIFRLVLVNWDKVTRGPMGLPGIPAPSLFGYEFDSRVPYYYLILVLFLLSLAACLRLTRSRIGRAFKAIRDAEEAAEFMGINTTRYKTMAFALGGAYAGLAGSFYAHYITFVSPDTFLFQDSAMALVMVFLGGAGTVFGPVLGAVVFVIVPEILRFLVEWRMLVVGALMVIMMIYRPEGLIGQRGARPGFRLPVVSRRSRGHEGVR